MPAVVATSEALNTTTPAPLTATPAEPPPLIAAATAMTTASTVSLDVAWTITCPSDQMLDPMIEAATWPCVPLDPWTCP